MRPYEVINGGSREQMFDCLRLLEEDREFFLTIIIEGKKRMLYSTIWSIEAVSNDGHEWLIETGDVFADITGKLVLKPLKIKYDSKKRKGEAKLSER